MSDREEDLATKVNRTIFKYSVIYAVILTVLFYLFDEV